MKVLFAVLAVAWLICAVGWAIGGEIPRFSAVCAAVVAALACVQVVLEQ